MNSKTHSKKYLVFDFLILSLALATLLWLALNRFIARDEGFYLMAAKLVVTGSRPYLDFFYPQMPLFPYLYGLWFKLTSFSWEQARIFSALLSFGSALLVYLTLRQCSGRVAAALGLALFTGSALVIGWFPTAKTYNASTLFCLLSYFAIVMDRKKSSTTWLAIAGLSIGLAVNCRLFYVVIIPILIWAILAKKSSNKKADLLYFLGGGAITTIPQIYFATADFYTYWFNNYEYHQIRSELSPQQITEHRLFILEVLFGLRDAARSVGLQFTLLLLGTLSHAFFRLCQRRPPDLAFWIGISLAVVSFMPVPIHIQYFCTSVPFFAICTVLFCFEFYHRFKATSLIRITALIVMTISLYLYCTIIPATVIRYTSTGFGIHGLDPQSPETSRYATAKKVSAELNKLAQPGELAISQWPGYLFESHTTPYPGTENHFWVHVGPRYGQDKRQRLRVVNREEFRQSVQNPELNYVVIERVRQRGYLPAGLLQRNGFTMVRDIKGVYIYKRSSEDTPTPQD